MTRARPTITEALQGLAFALFALTVLLSIAAVNLRVGPVPVRSLTLLASGLLLFFPDPMLLRQAAVTVRRLIYLITAVAMLGVFVSVIARAPVGGTIEQVVEIHIQAVIGSFIACGLMLRFGVALVILCFLGAFGLSVLVGFGQALGIDLAWRMRSMIGSLMNDPPVTQFTYVTRYRVLGLCYTPVHFATQSCLALAGLFYLRAMRIDGSAIPFDRVILTAAIVLAALCILTGNRSPLLGMFIFVAIYAAVAAPHLALALLPLMLVAALVAIPLLRYLSEAGLRVADTDNGSAAGRATLRAFGLFLVEQRPIGYGLTFDSLDHWTRFTHQANGMENPLVIRRWAVHNYYLNMMAKYGVAILAALPAILPRNRRDAFLWLAFVPYSVHAFYHNDGPLQGDFLIFYILPAAILVAQRWRGAAEADQVKRLKRPWRRAFATAGTSHP